MGQIAERVGTRWTVIVGALMVALGLVVSTLGSPWPLWIGHGLFIGLIGLGGINAPLYVYVSRWFDRRRGSALALISSGSYLAGAIWPPLFERAVASIGWRQTMLWYALLEVPGHPPACGHLLHASARGRPYGGRARRRGGAGARSRLGAESGVRAPLRSGGPVLCADGDAAEPPGRLLRRSGYRPLGGRADALRAARNGVPEPPGVGAVSDRIGGLATIFVGSLWQMCALSAFLLTQDERGLFTVSAAFGLGFSGIVPAYVLALRELYPASQAAWRIPTLLLFTGSGMAMGGWLAGALYDHFGSYAPAFATGVGANAINLLLIGTLLARRRYRRAFA
jgi:MFS family permease